MISLNASREPTGKLNPEPWPKDTSTLAVMNALTTGGADVRYVGGCVRDEARVRDAALSRGWHLNLPPILRVTDETNATCAPHARRAIATPEKTQRAPVCHSHGESESRSANGPRRHAASVWKGC